MSIEERNGGAEDKSERLAFPVVAEGVNDAWQRVVARGTEGFTDRDIAEAVADELNADPGFAFIRRSEGLGETIDAEEVLGIRNSKS